MSYLTPAEFVTKMMDAGDSSSVDVSFSFLCDRISFDSLNRSV